MMMRLLWNFSCTSNISYPRPCQRQDTRRDESLLWSSTTISVSQKETFIRQQC